MEICEFRQEGRSVADAIMDREPKLQEAREVKELRAANYFFWEVTSHH
jgi:hypothetical protein